MNSLKIRGNIIMLFFAVVLMVFIGRLFSVQVLSKEYARKADRYVIKTKNIIPPRGNVYNRDGDIYVSNRPMFNMLVTPEKLFIPDMNILENYLRMDRAEIEKAIAAARKYSRQKESVIARYIEPEVYGALQEETWNFRGINFSASNKRTYHYQVGANILGYISEVSQRDIDRSEGKYMIGDLIGKTGIERSHDSTLRGVQGEKKILTDVHNRVVGSYAEGHYDKKAEKGKDVMLGIDTDLQGFGEWLMEGKKGSIVAIEPSSGEILSFVSAPSYNPSGLTGRELDRNWVILNQDSTKPLFNRPLMAAYPPGSIFKLAVGLAAMNEGIISPNTYYSCGGSFKRNKGKPGCRFHVTPLSFGNAVKHSCNSYFAATYMDFLLDKSFPDIYKAYDRWQDYMTQMGLGNDLGVDLPYEKSGSIPSAAKYDKWYGHDRWSATTIISNAIGQGEILMTPLQMANLSALIANKGNYVRPHFLRAIRGRDDDVWHRVSYERVNTEIQTRHFQTVIDAMEQVVANGTARRAQIEGITVCGKTGTVENPHGEDHAVFLGFAPKDN
ncbi:MAG: penicillin-binding transpeptidase domain-containing protein, partial [Bacteroidota bacterium]